MLVSTSVLPETQRKNIGVNYPLPLHRWDKRDIVLVHPDDTVG